MATEHPGLHKQPLKSLIPFVLCCENGSTEIINIKNKYGIECLLNVI